MKHNKILFFISLILMLFFSHPVLQCKEWKNIDMAMPPSDISYYSLKCADSLNCMIWAVIRGEWGYFFRRTTDGGVTWKNVFLDSSYYHGQKDYYNTVVIRDIAYPSKNLFIAIGDSGTILRTTDRGETWEKKVLDKKRLFYMIRMLDENYGVMLGGIYEPITVEMYETTDGGKNWTKMNYPPEIENTGFYDYQIIRKGLIVALTRVNSNPAKFYRIYGNWESFDTLPVRDRCIHMFFIDDNNGWITGGTKINSLNFTQLIMHTSDGGVNWELQRDKVYNGYTINGIQFFDENYGMATGGIACVLRTYNGGKNWKEDSLEHIPETSGSAFVVTSLQMPSITNAYVIANSTYIYKYTRDWSFDNVNQEYEASNSIQNYPNPFSDNTTISYSLNKPSKVNITVYDILGIKQVTILDEYQESGKHNVEFTGNNLSPGTYYYIISSAVGTVAGKMVKIR